MDHRAGEQGRSGEGQQRAGQDEDVGCPRRRRSGEVEREPDQRRQDRGLVDPRGGAALAERGIPPHQVDLDGTPGGGEHVGQDGDHRPRRPGEGRGRRNDPEATVGAHGPRLERHLPDATPTPRRERRAEHEPEAGGQGEGAEQLSRRRQPPRRHQRQGRRREQDLGSQDDGPDPLRPRPTLRRAPAEQPTRDEADQAEHPAIVAAGRPWPALACPIDSEHRRVSVRRCTLNGFVRC